MSDETEPKDESVSLSMTVPFRITFRPGANWPHPFCVETGTAETGTVRKYVESMADSLELVENAQ